MLRTQRPPSTHHADFGCVRHAALGSKDLGVSSDGPQDPKDCQDRAGENLIVLGGGGTEKTRGKGNVAEVASQKWVYSVCLLLQTSLIFPLCSMARIVCIYCILFFFFKSLYQPKNLDVPFPL